MLKQTLPEAERSTIRLKAKIPEDFAAKFKFTFTGGVPWRSVGLSFDVADENEALVYASANDGAPKLQISYRQGANYEYPPQGTQNRPFKVGDTVNDYSHPRHEVINVDEWRTRLAYRLPLFAKGRRNQLITYAASADFKYFELTSLPTIQTHRAHQREGPVAKPIIPEQARLASCCREIAGNGGGRVTSDPWPFHSRRAKFSKQRTLSRLQLPPREPKSGSAC